MENNRINILVLGATGHLGHLITTHALANSKFNVSVLIRDLEKSKDLVKEVESKGGKVIKGDVNDVNSIKDVTKGIHTVISALNAFDEKTMIEGQSNVLNDAIKNGVKRFFPSEYALNYEKATKEENPVVNLKLSFQEILDKAPIQSVRVSQGLFTETYFAFQAQGFGYWGDINQKLDLTTFDDLARYIVAVAAEPEKHGRFVFVGEELSTKQIAEIYNKVRGTNLEPRRNGSLEEYDALVEKLKNEGNFVGYTYSGLGRIMYSGRGKFHKFNNSEYPEIKRTSFEEFLKKNPEYKLQ